MEWNVKAYSDPRALSSPSFRCLPRAAGWTTLLTEVHAVLCIPISPGVCQSRLEMSRGGQVLLYAFPVFLLRICQDNCERDHGNLQSENRRLIGFACNFCYVRMHEVAEATCKRPTL